MVYKDEVMLPYPWSCLASVAVMFYNHEPLVVFQSFQDKFLHLDGPMHVTIGALRTKLANTPGTEVVSDAKHEPHLLAMLKDQGVVASRVARVKLISLAKMQQVLLKAGQRQDHVAALIAVHQSLVQDHTASEPQDVAVVAAPAPSTSVPPPQAPPPQAPQGSIGSTTALAASTGLQQLPPRVPVLAQLHGVLPHCMMKDAPLTIAMVQRIGELLG
jgi:hypothetical protein